jgi:helicase SWR1
LRISKDTDPKQANRAHRIGQVRDVEVYKMVSEKTVEENILQRANQKSLLDQTVIQEGHFTTEYQRHRETTSTAEPEDEDGADVAAAIERFLGSNNEKETNQALESVEDKEDVQAAQQARKEEHQDDADFADRSSKGPSGPPTPGHHYGDDNAGEDEGRKGHVDYYLIRQMEFLLKRVPFIPPQVRRTDRHGRDPSHRKRKR